MPKITKQAIEAIKPTDKDQWLWDTELQGFGVRIQPSGRMTYVMRYRTRDAARVQRKVTICRCSDAPPAKARDLARELFLQVAGGGDPAAERRPERVDASGPTLEAMFKARVAAMRARGRANAGEVERVLLLAKYNAADTLGRNRAPGSITPDEVVRLVSKYFAEGHRGAADKARGYLAATFEWAIKSANDYTVANRQDWGVKTNPAAAVAKDHGAIKVRDRNLDAKQLRVVWEACHDGNGGFTEGVEACLKTMIACGQRVQETLRMCGSEVDLEAAVWRMPAEKTKGKKRPHTIPLPRVIIPTLLALKDQHGDGPLFVARTGSTQATLGAISVSHAVRRWCESEGCPVPAFQPRDLRRTWKSRTHDAGIDRFTRDLIQQHAKQDTGSKNYDRADYFAQMREAMDKWDAWLKANLFDKPPLVLVA